MTTSLAAHETVRDGAALDVVGLTLHYGDVRAVDAISFSVAPGSTLCLLGASGSGKSSVLRLIAGLERPSAGRIAVNGSVMVEEERFVEPEHRRVGMVFQDFALFPHLTVESNVAFGLRHRSRAEAAEVVHALLVDVGLRDHARRYPHMLSGGERQRVALARALAPQPDVLLLDEPFSSLDVQLRSQIRQHTLDLLRRRGTTTVLVTHDPHEALRVADRICVLANGRVAQSGTPADIYRHPCSPEMASAFGATNVLEGTIENGSLHTPVGVFDAAAGASTGPATVCVRPQHVVLGAAGTGVRGVVTAVTYVGDATEVQVRVNDVLLVARVPEWGCFTVGDEPFLSVDPSSFFVFPRHAAFASAAA